MGFKDVGFGISTDTGLNVVSAILSAKKMQTGLTILQTQVILLNYIT